ncbi:MAG: Nif3-like dinuclear metal center hexameric protein [Ruminococcus sp.]|nr:Nif3-like dinuclear metal center hexameric protein [Ruminococcus sp.]
MKINDIIEYTKALAPYETSEEWDNVGLLVGDGDREVSRVLIALDITPAVVEEARAIGAQLIVSHHPVIFDPLRVLVPDDAVYLLAKYDIAALCLHTNLDRAEEGVNVQLGRALGLRDAVFYPEDFLLVGSPEKPCDSAEYAAVIKERLDAPSVRYTEGRVTRVAVSSGGGGDGVELAGKYGFDAFVTGEMKHHQYLWANAHGIAAFDAGHYPTENIITEPLQKLLQAQFSNAEFIFTKKNPCPYRGI